jgi:hypothetical protein
MNGKRVELFGGIDKGDAKWIVPGDYLARLVDKRRDDGGAVLHQQYFVLLPDATGWPCTITGFSE